LGYLPGRRAGKKILKKKYLGYARSWDFLCALMAIREDLLCGFFFQPGSITLGAGKRMDGELIDYLRLPPRGGRERERIKQRKRRQRIK
jgi:hypothetical protein